MIARMAVRAAEFLVVGVRDLLATLLSVGLIACVRCYQRFVSPPLHACTGPLCRFTPTCSEYAILAIRRHGPIVGAAKAAWRIARCHPWSRGGHDPP